MPRKNHVPAYLFHKATGQAYVKLPDGVGGYNFVYLGAHGTAASRAAYRQKLAEHDADREAGGALAAVSANPTVAQVFVAFLRHAAKHYRRPDGTPTNEVQEYKALSVLVNEIYASLPAADFGPKKLKAVREMMVAKGWCRRTINQRIDRLRLVFKYAAAEELVPAAVFDALGTVTGLQKGRRPEIPESTKVPPVPDDVVEATLPHLGRHVRGMVEFQRLTGCRPTEACMLRRADIDTGGAVWLYRPPTHKGTWRGSDRIIAIGPAAQKLLREFFTPSIDDYLFSPRRAVEEIRAKNAAARKTPRYPSHLARNVGKRVERPQRRPAERYNRISYFTAVLRACDRAFPPSAELGRRRIEAAGDKPAKLESTKAWLARLTPEQRAALAQWRKEHRWAPNQLRHNHGTKVRKQFGLEAAQVALGHAKADVTQIYAERNLELAVKVAEKIG